MGAPSDLAHGALMLHAVAPAAVEPPAVGGLGEPPAAVRRVAAGELAALVSPVPEQRAPGTRADLEAHARVVAAAIEGGTVLPVRFGVVFDGADEVREVLLERRAEELLRVLETLRDRVQVTLKAYYDEGSLLHDIASSHPEIARLSEETRGRDDPAAHAAKVQLGERVMAALERRRGADERALVDRLAPLAERVIVDEPRNERIVVHAHLLVQRSRRAEVDRLVAELADELGGRITFRLVGPLAPWSFVDLELDAGEPAWA